MRTMFEKPSSRKHPVQREKFDRWRERLRCHAAENSVLFRIDPMLAFEVEALLHAYYGGEWRMIFALIRKHSVLSYHSLIGRVTFWFCDFIGWTKVYFYPETRLMRAHHQRHGRKCSGSPNCSNMNCIDDSIPSWFKKICRWDKYP